MYKAGVRDGLMLLNLYTHTCAIFLPRTLGLGDSPPGIRFRIRLIGMGSSTLFATFPTIGKV